MYASTMCTCTYYRNSSAIRNIIEYFFKKRKKLEYFKENTQKAEYEEERQGRQQRMYLVINLHVYDCSLSTVRK